MTLMMQKNQLCVMPSKMLNLLSRRRLLFYSLALLLLEHPEGCVPGRVFLREKYDLLVLVENLYPNEGIEDQSSQLFFFLLAFASQDLLATKIQDECNYELENGLSDNHLPHIESDQWSRLLLRLAIENIASRGIGCERESSESVHDEVYPEKLYSRKNRLLG